MNKQAFHQGYIERLAEELVKQAQPQQYLQKQPGGGWAGKPTGLPAPRQPQPPAPGGEDGLGWRARATGLPPGTPLYMQRQRLEGKPLFEPPQQSTALGGQPLNIPGQPSLLAAGSQAPPHLRQVFQKIPQPSGVQARTGEAGRGSVDPMESVAPQQAQQVAQRMEKYDPLVAARASIENDLKQSPFSPTLSLNE